MEMLAFETLEGEEQEVEKGSEQAAPAEEVVGRVKASFCNISGIVGIDWR